MQLDQLGSEIQVSKPSFPPTRTLRFLILLSAGIGGLQGVFALIFSNGFAHLGDLGLSKAARTLVWITLPLAGMTVQPYCGIRSDQCLSSWGRRRPFIASGAIVAVVSLLGLASTERLAAVVVRLGARGCSPADACSKEEPAKAAAASLAAVMTVFFIMALSIALQPLQGGLRALMVDMCPRAQQPAATAVAGAVVSASNILCYAVGFVDLPRISVLRALGGDSQFAILCIITSVTLAVSVGLTCLVVRERSAVLGDDGLSAAARGTRNTARAQLWYLCTSFPRLPPQVQQVFKVQFFSWIGWFPFLFYAATYLSETYKNETPAVQRFDEGFQARAAKVGPLGLMLFALVAFVAGAFLSTAHKHANRGGQVFGNTFTGLIRSLRRMWITSQVLFAVCMFATAFAPSLRGVYILVSLSGISWSVTIWAPFALISAHTVHDTGRRSGETIYSQPLMRDEEDSLIEDYEQQNLMVGEKEGDDGHVYGEEADDVYERRPGVIMGLHNVAIAAPQIAAAASCSLIFWILEGSSQDSVGWTLRFGGLAALGAAIMASEIQEEVSEFPLKNLTRCIVRTG
ncbi:hypothetical protein GGI42DRAFT_323610 [Trichoderma sp. SZMC 28013]